MFFKNKKISSDLYGFLKEDYCDSYRVIIEFKKFQKSFEKTITSLSGKVIRNFDSINIICASLSARSIYRLVEYPEVLAISLDEYCFLCGMSISTANGINNNITSNLSGKGVNIALIDSGTFPHPDLSSPSRILKFTDLINDFSYPYDDNGHGTALSTIISGSGISSRYKFTGIATRSSLVSYKAFNTTGKAYFSDVLYSLELVIKDAEELNIKLLCMPFESFNTTLKHINYFDLLLEKVISKGIIPLMPTGSNQSTLSGLANAKNTILIAGLDNKFAPFDYSSTSNNKKNINVSSNCKNISCGNTITSYISQRGSAKIYPPKLKEPYTNYSGTSVATAYICGVCALLLEKYPEYTFKDVSSRIELCSKSLPDVKKKFVGEGILDVENFLK